MGLIGEARAGSIGALVKKIAREESVGPSALAADIAAGFTVIPRNKKRGLTRPCGIGRGMRTKVNVNIGTSPDSSSIAGELKKLRLSLSLGADAIMDLSVGKDVKKTRMRILDNCPVPLGTVPVYQAAVNVGNDISAVTERGIMDVLEEQAEEGVDFFTIHAGVTLETARLLDRSRRVIPIVSRGGAILYKWMRLTKRQNPMYSLFDEILDLARAYDITLSLGDGMRPGSVADASDRAQFGELKLLGRLQKRALKKGVQTIIEGPGHVPLDQIRKNMELQKKYCNGAPFYVLGPLVTDIAPGYDHITSAIGGAVAASYGADFLCYVTPAEHLRLPTIDDVRDGLVASKIAAHAADIARGNKAARKRDRDISVARRQRNWARQFDLAIDAAKPKQYRKKSSPALDDVCTMCGNYCPIKLHER